MKVGDKVKFVHKGWKKGLVEGQIYTIESVSDTSDEVTLEGVSGYRRASRFELVPKFKVGDRVRDLSTDEVLTVARVYADGSITGESLNGDLTAYGSNELEPFTAGGPLDIRVGRVYAVPTIQSVPSATDAAFGACPESEDLVRELNKHVKPATSPDIGLDELETLTPERLKDLQDTLKSCKQALRYNEGKGEHDYLLTYPGGVDAVFPESFPYYNTLSALADWYRNEVDTSTDYVIRMLRLDAEEAGHDLATALAETNERAARPRADGTLKYPKGNYLKGANYRQYCQSFIRHCKDLAKGLLYDAEGNNTVGAIAFNILALDMCVTQGIGTDDRIRAPK